MSKEKETKVHVKASEKKEAHTVKESPKKTKEGHVEHKANSEHEHEKAHVHTEHKEHSVKAKKTDKKSQYDWVDYKPKEIEEAIINLANTGSSPSQIGLILRDQYGIPKMKKVANQTVSEVLIKHKLIGEVPEDLLNLIRKSVKLDRHLAQNKKDMSAKRGLQLTVSKIRRLTDYYHKNKRLPKDWIYTPEKAALLTK